MVINYKFASASTLKKSIMGVPALFRWLHGKYPKITSSVIEQKPEFSGQVIDTCLPNPNGFETDYLYLDMNGIIHPCCHNEYNETPDTEEGMFQAIFSYIDRVFNMVRPRKLLYFAIDGVAPRAKMNQQRSRRFRAAQDAKAKIPEDLVGQDFDNDYNVSEGIDDTLCDDKSGPFDSNCITPGTRFMADLKIALEYYITARLNLDSGWRNILVILSDASVPGEGEHKIMTFIRNQRAQPNYNPNLMHVMYGLDADLIMLALATHEVHFKVLREDVFFEQSMKRKFPGSHEASVRAPSLNDPKPFIFLDVYTLREYLYFEFRSGNGSRISEREFKFERLIDDWIFLIFFVGNDFLPHMPSIEIREGAIDLLVDLYKQHWTGYLTENGQVHIQKVCDLLDVVGHREDAIFQQRKEREDTYLQAAASKRRRYNQSRDVASEAPAKEELSEDLVRLWEQGARERYYQSKLNADIHTKEGAHLVHEMTKCYLEGVSWVMEYYYRGCPSWQWFYPYHYAPFASDIGKFEFSRKDSLVGSSTAVAVLKELESSEKSQKEIERPKKIEEGHTGDIFEFLLGKPFKPFEQLLGVLPSASSKLLPPIYHSLMNDPLSELSEFYPSTFKIDLNGKQKAWQGVALLPFIQQDKLLKASERLELKLNEKDKVRNMFGHTLLFFSNTHPIFRNHFFREKSRVALPENNLTLHGLVSPNDSYDHTIPFKCGLPDMPMPVIETNNALCLFYEDPSPPKLASNGEHLYFEARLLPGIQLPPSHITMNDFLDGKQDSRFHGRGNTFSNNTGALHVQMYHQSEQTSDYSRRRYEDQRPQDYQKHASFQDYRRTGHDYHRSTYQDYRKYNMRSQEQGNSLAYDSQQVYSNQVSYHRASQEYPRPPPPYIPAPHATPNEYSIPPPARPLVPPIHSAHLNFNYCSNPYEDYAASYYKSGGYQNSGYLSQMTDYCCPSSIPGYATASSSAYDSRQNLYSSAPKVTDPATGNVNVTQVRERGPHRKLPTPEAHQQRN